MSKLQTPTTPRMYVSWLLYQYANGGLDTVKGTGIFQDVPEEQIMKLITGDPSSINNLKLNLETGNEGYIAFRIRHSDFNEESASHDEFNKYYWRGANQQYYFSILGHELANIGTNVVVQPFTAIDVSAEDINNFSPINTGTSSNNFVAPVPLVESQKNHG